MKLALLAWLLAITDCDKLATGEQRAEAPEATEAQCAQDDDCAIVPAVFTCCPDESCPPAPPFSAAPRWQVDAMYIENEDRCRATERTCERCPPVPSGCRANAVCTAGRCTAVAIGCELPTS